MRICKLLLRNFGKFADKDITLSEGINVLYGENESGKSTIHTFIKGMLFGMERGRGRAAANDAFSRYEPWDNSNYYSGKMSFEVGGKHFSIDRNFDRYTKKVMVVCEEDGEELSVSDGDLDMLLDGLTPQLYDNTISIAQLKAEPGSTLATELKNYATNYYVTGDSELDLNAALQILQEKRRESDKKVRELAKEKQAQRERIEQEISYVWRDIHRLTQEQEHLAHEIGHREQQVRERDNEPETKGVIDELRPAKWRIHPLEIILFILIVVAAVCVIHKPWNYLVAIVLALCFGIYVWNRLKVGRKVEKTEPEKILEEITSEEEKIPLDRLRWEQERGAEELRDKQIRYSNLQESLEEIDEVTDEYKTYDRQKYAAQLAMDKITELAGSFQERLKRELNERASEIISEITGGKYTRLIVDAEFSMSLMLENRKVSTQQVSQGTVEQVYFALRMAAVELLHEEEYPVILDDAFVCYDDKRLEQVLRWLYENKKQVLLFTCQNREEEALDRIGAVYSKIEIK